MSSVESTPAPQETGAAPEAGTAIRLGGFDDRGCYQPTVHPGATVVNTGTLIDVYATNRMIADLSRRRIDDQARIRISALATWSETILLGEIAAANPEYDGYWFDTAAGVWRSSSEGRS